jgi:hypothetical protein
MDLAEVVIEVKRIILQPVVSTTLAVLIDESQQ